MHFKDGSRLRRRNPLRICSRHGLAGLECMLCVSCHLVQAWERAEVAAPKADTVDSICGGVIVHQGSNIAIVIVNY